MGVNKFYVHLLPSSFPQIELAHTADYYSRSEKIWITKFSSQNKVLIEEKKFITHGFESNIN